MSDQQWGHADSDEVLISRAREGDRRAYAELWNRHYRSGVRAARRFTSIDADDLVSEAFARIYQRVLAGGGPTGAFRPYLYAALRNLAASWGSAAREVNIDWMDDLEDATLESDPAALALDRTLTARAFRSLPERWQTVLWYTEVEGMDPHEVAPLLGITANSVAALSYRAREGLRKAWLQAHVSDASARGDCRWALSRLGDHARRGLTARDTARIEGHLATCTRCAIISDEVEEVGSRLALVMLPILLGSAAGGGLIASLAEPSTAQAAPVPDPPASFEPASTGVSHVDAAVLDPALLGGVVAPAAAPVAAGLSLGAASGPTALVGSLAIAVAVTGGVAITAVAPPAAPPAAVAGADPAPPGAAPSENRAPVTDAERADPAAPVIGGDPAPAVDDPAPAADDPANVPAPAPRDAPGAVEAVVGGVVDAVTGDAPPAGHTAPGGAVGADIHLDLSGSGTPGARVSLQAAGRVYATTTVTEDGRFALGVAVLPAGTSVVEVVQEVDRGHLASLVGGLLGPLDRLVDALIRPISLDATPAQVRVDLMTR